MTTSSFLTRAGAALVLLATAAAAQCPYTGVQTPFGNGCAVLGPSAPTLLPGFPQPGCEESLLFTVPVAGGGITVAQSWLVAGAMPLSATLPSGCTLLVQPAVILPLGLAFEGTVGLELLLPPDPQLVGVRLFFQSVVLRVAPGGNQAFETSNGLQLDLT